MIDKENLQNFSIKYHDDFLLMSDEFQFNGLTLKTWAQKFLIEIPENVDQYKIAELYKRIDNLQTIAHNNNLVAYGIYSFHKRELEKKQTQEYLKIYNDVSKKTTAIQSEHNVNYQTSSIEDKFVVAKYVYDFWQEQLKYLDKKVKILENINWALRNIKESF